MSRFPIVAGVLVLSFGLRVVYDAVWAPDTTPLPPRIPLSDLPMDIAGPGWVGENAPLQADVVRIAEVCEYVHRVYRCGDSTMWLYVGYVAGWKPSAIHYPGVCYPSGGLELESERVVTIPCQGTSKELSFRESEWKETLGTRSSVYSLTSFYYSGKFEPNVWRMRADSIEGIRYFATVTLSGGFMDSLEETRKAYAQVLCRVVENLLKHFSD